MSSNYPLLSQSELSRAPWNQEEPKPKKVEVTVSITLSKTMTVDVTDYSTEKEIDEEGNTVTNYDFSECDLKQAVRDQVTLPNEAFNELHHAVFLAEDYQARQSLEDLEGWCEDDFEVNLEE